MRAGHVPALLLSLLVSTAASAAPISLTLSTSGYLLDAADHPLSQQGLSVKFSLWTDPSATLETSRIWPESGESECLVSVVNGLYAAVLDGSLATGCGAGLSSAHLPPASPRYLQISVGGVTLTPRMRVGMVPTSAVATRALDSDAVNGEAPAALHDASKLTGVAPGTVLGTGYTGLTTVGTVTTGTWQGTKVADAYIDGAATWNAVLAAVAHDGTLVGDGTAGANQLKVNLGTAAGTVAAGNDARFGQWTGLSTGLDAAAARTSLGLGTAATTPASAYATAAQGATADAALPRAGGTITGVVNFPGNGIWNAAGNVGLGTSSPQAKLDVMRTETTPNALFEVARFHLANGAADRGLAVLVPTDGMNAIGLKRVGTGSSFVLRNQSDVDQFVLDDAGNLGLGTSSPQAKLDVTGEIRGGGTSQLLYANRTASLDGTVSGMTTIPGMSVTLTLARPAVVRMSAGGTQRAVTGGCHVGYGFTVNGSLRDNPGYGSRIQVSDPSYWWQTWSVERTETLAAGTYTITTAADDTSGGCVICGEAGGAAYDYATCSMSVLAVSQ